MSEPIKVGDLVMLIRPRTCCGTVTKAVGSLIYRVESIYYSSGHCSYCGSSKEGLKAAGEGHYIMMSRLKRIPPLSELDDVKQDEEIHA